jgi:hypothetical protein
MEVGIPGFFYIAPTATHIATAYTNEPGRFAGMEAFALKTVEFFHQG